MDSYIGQIRLFAGNYAPQGWAICNGALLSIQQYQALFSLLGTTWGGNGTTTFGLPDLRGRLPVGQGQGAGLTARPLGQVGGTSTVGLTQANYPAHTHQLVGSSVAADTPTVAAGVGLATTASSGAAILTRYADSSQTGTNAPVVAAMDDLSIGPAGASGPTPHQNLMPYQALNFIICLNGLYPSRP